MGDRIYFKNYDEIIDDLFSKGTPIPKVIHWYALKTKLKWDLDADYCNKLLNNDLKEFFEKYPEELTNAVLFNWKGETNITKEDKKFYKKEIKIKWR